MDPQVITAAGDAHVRTWDLAAGKCMTILTHHKKAVRALALSATDFSFASGSTDNIKKWKLPESRFVQNFAGHDAIINRLRGWLLWWWRAHRCCCSLALNDDGVLVSAADNGTIKVDGVHRACLSL